MQAPPPRALRRSASLNEPDDLDSVAGGDLGGCQTGAAHDLPVDLDRQRHLDRTLAFEHAARNVLFDEKIGGTVHLALGSSYPATGGTNQSALHWDMVCDLRQGGEIWVDGALFAKDGAFTSNE